MLFELAHVPYAEGYGDTVLPLAAARAHLSADGDDDEDALIAALRDAAISFVEQYCATRLLSTTGLVWRAEGLPSAACEGVSLGMHPVNEITAIAWSDSDGAPVDGNAGDYRVGLHGKLFPAIGGQWPSGVGGAVEVTFTAGYAENQVPPSLLQAVKLMLGHLYMNREAVVAQGATGEVPLGVRALCAPFRPIVI